MVEKSSTSSNLIDLLPKKRLENLYEIAKHIHVDNGVNVSRYFDIAKELLKKAKKFKNERKCEDSLLDFLRYQILVKKLKSHVGFKNVCLAERAAFDYKLKDVARNVKSLTEQVFKGYKKVYDLIDYNTDNFLMDGYQEQRTTVSTVKTFVSTSRQSYVVANKRRPSGGQNKSVLTQQRMSQIINAATLESSESADINYGLRKSIFPSKQVKEFNEIHKQRRIVRGHRTVVIPSRITTVFSYLSLFNNKKNIETVGYLAGKELNTSRLIITHVLLPKQQGYSDYFKVIDSNSLIDYLEENNLMTIGWIHSHPVETPYMSSSDMHYHCVFQSVLPEAIAIVYSPREMRSQVFNLTPNHGLKTINECRKKGFHTHSTQNPLIMDSHHTVTDLVGELTVKDFRWNDSETMSASEKEQIPTISSGIGHRSIDRLLQMKTTIREVSPLKVRQSEVNFVHLDSRI